MSDRKAFPEFLPVPGPGSGARHAGRPARSFVGFLRDFLRDETAATVVEYGLIAGLISLVGLAGAPTVGAKVLGLYNRIVTAYP